MAELDLHSYEMFLSDAGPERLLVENPNFTMRGLVETERATAEMTSMYDFVHQIGLYLSPDRYAPANMFSEGGLIAVCVVVKLLPKPPFEDIMQYEPGIDLTEDDVEVDESNASIIQAEAERGYLYSLPYDRLFEADKDTFCRDEFLQIFLKWGFGYVFRMVKIAQDRAIEADRDDFVRSFRNVTLDDLSREAADLVDGNQP